MTNTRSSERTRKWSTAYSSILGWSYPMATRPTGEQLASGRRGGEQIWVAATSYRLQQGVAATSYRPPLTRSVPSLLLDGSGVSQPATTEPSQIWRGSLTASRQQCVGTMVSMDGNYSLATTQQWPSHGEDRGWKCPAESFQCFPFQLQILVATTGYYLTATPRAQKPSRVGAEPLCRRAAARLWNNAANKA
ncbi:uncharacterized protein LOC110431981 [Sorghum bicolor]|uniref:Uncharacterized protein n=1 Tax=Sorghum bicolor TaxID=4558 RepID=A0A1B6QJI9_SORBI|nr:uncharacterized protein LOC110431981 [Sorghum bicolor]KXG38082.1 hypothetical protein SORBI_3001G177500 [Sorghum bicolor]|eukprot:XP_021307539.1 uncharacterized protein LOC110431981 [Sorghum bicolor]